MRAGHYGNLTFIDRQVEGIITLLEERGELDDTIVVWSADHGSLLGDHDLIHKDTQYERSCHVPFVVRWPGQIPAGEIDGFTTHVDVMPTFLGAAGASVPDGVEGVDLMPLLTREVDHVQDCVFMEIRSTTAIFTDKYKLNINKGPRFPSDYGVYDWHLVDREKDPDEFVNVANDPAYDDVKAELLERIFQFHPPLRDVVKVPPPAQAPEPRSLIATQGEHFGLQTEREPIHLDEKAFTITAQVEPVDGQKTKGVICCYQVGPHGFILAVDDDELYFEWTVFGDPVTVKTAQIPTGEFAVTVEVGLDAAITIWIDAKVVATGQAASLIPHPPGRNIRETAGDLWIGMSGGRVSEDLIGSVKTLTIEIRS